MNAHLSPDTIAGYFSDTLSDADQLVVEEHVAGCDVCALDAQEVFAADTVVDRWTARAHGMASRQAVLVRALDVVGQRVTAASVRARLAAWADSIAEQAEAAVRVLLEAPTQAAYRLARQASDLTRPAPGLQFAPAAMPIRGPGRGGASRGAAQPIVVQAGAGGPTAQVAVSGGRREVVVRLDGVPRGSEPPLVLLVRATPESVGDPSHVSEREALLPGGAMAAAAAPPPPPAPAQFSERSAFEPAQAAPSASLDARLAVPMPSPGSDAWIARFDGLAEGEYLILFEPRP